MLKMCNNSIYSSSIYKSLEFILGQCLETSVLPSEHKKANAVPDYGKGGKQILKTTMQNFLWETNIQVFY